MLIDTIIDFCDKEFSAQYTGFICKDCSHMTKCPGNCRNCLEEIHYPYDHPDGKKDYNCNNLINYYVCDYTYKYSSEILYLLRQTKTLEKLDRFSIVSIGCGGCPDLMAFETYLDEKEIKKSISYFGIDINKLWKPIHGEIKEYGDKTSKFSATFEYADAIELFNNFYYEDINIIILQYVISFFYSTKQITQIESFFDNLVSNIIDHKKANTPFIVIINDVNSCYTGRDNFNQLIKKLKDKEYHGKCPKYYFDFRIKNDGQRYGVNHSCYDILYKVPSKIDKYKPWRECSSAQLLIEIE